MKAASTILMVMVLAGCASSGARRCGEGKDSCLDVLNEDQKAYMEWTNRFFASYLNRDEFVGISKSSKKHLEQKWIEMLDGSEKEANYNAINSLAAIRSQKGVKPLLKIAAERREKDNRDRWMATRALGLLGDESVVPELIHLVYHYNQNTRIWAQISLVRLTGVDFGSDWQKWGQWWNSEGGEPAFSPEKVVWTTRADWADEEKQQKSDKAFATRSKEGAKRNSGGSVETYIVTFEPVGEFKPQTASELLNAFNEKHPKGVRTHHYRTRAETDRLRGYICVDTKQGADKVVAMLEESKRLVPISVQVARGEALDKLYKLGQPSLKK